MPNLVRILCLALAAEMATRHSIWTPALAEAAPYSLECPVCFGLPAAGEWHQCLEGHCYCIDCWRRLRPRRCPECKDPIPLRNRNRDREAMVAALPAVCDHCGETTTLGAMAEHRRACQQRPTTSHSGYGWLRLGGDGGGACGAREDLSPRAECVAAAAGGSQPARDCSLPNEIT